MNKQDQWSMKKGLKNYWPLDCYITEGQKLGTFLENKVVCTYIRNIKVVKTVVLLD